jgi:hypothetical protein
LATGSQIPCSAAASLSKDGIYVNDARLDRCPFSSPVSPHRGRRAAATRVPYRDFRMGLSPHIKANIEDRLAKTFAGRKSLQERIQAIGGVLYGRNRARQAAALPFPSTCFLFWDKDDEFDDRCNSCSTGPQNHYRPGGLPWCSRHVPETDRRRSREQYHEQYTDTTTRRTSSTASLPFSKRRDSPYSVRRTASRVLPCSSR